MSIDGEGQSKSCFARVPGYASPPVQVLIVALAFFLCPGMFNALTGIGGSGQINHRAANDANTALYATFAVVGFFAGAVVNVIGVKTSLCFGGLGYCLYVAAFLCYSHTQNYGFTHFCGGLLGSRGALLWTAGDTVIMSYPPRESKGKYIGCFWMIFSMGAVVGSLVSGQSLTSTRHRLMRIDSPKPKHSSSGEQYNLRRHLRRVLDRNRAWHRTHVDPGRWAKGGPSGRLSCGSHEESLLENRDTGLMEDISDRHIYCPSLPYVLCLHLVLHLYIQ